MIPVLLAPTLLENHVIHTPTKIGVSDKEGSFSGTIIRNPIRTKEKIVDRVSGRHLTSQTSMQHNGGQRNKGKCTPLQLRHPDSSTHSLIIIHHH